MLGPRAARTRASAPRRVTAHRWSCAEEIVLRRAKKATPPPSAMHEICGGTRCKGAAQPVESEATNHSSSKTNIKNVLEIEGQKRASHPVHDLRGGGAMYCSGGSVDPTKRLTPNRRHPVNDDDAPSTSCNNWPVRSHVTYGQPRRQLELLPHGQRLRERTSQGRKVRPTCNPPPQHYAWCRLQCSRK